MTGEAGGGSVAAVTEALATGSFDSGATTVGVASAVDAVTGNVPVTGAKSDVLPSGVVVGAEGMTDPVSIANIDVALTVEVTVDDVDDELLEIDNDGGVRMTGIRDPTGIGVEVRALLGLIVTVSVSWIHRARESISSLRSACTWGDHQGSLSAFI